MCYCVAGKVRGSCVPGCVGVILYAMMRLTIVTRLLLNANIHMTGNCDIIMLGFW